MVVRVTRSCVGFTGICLFVMLSLSRGSRGTSLERNDGSEQVDVTPTVPDRFNATSTGTSLESNDGSKQGVATAKVPYKFKRGFKGATLENSDGRRPAVFTNTVHDERIPRSGNPNLITRRKQTTGYVNLLKGPEPKVPDMPLSKKVYPRCRLIFTDQRQVCQYKNLVQTKKMIRIPVRISFGDGVIFHDTKESPILLRNEWTWFYSGEDGSLQYLNWPVEALVWSVGLLGIAVTNDPLLLTLVKNEYCPSTLQLTAGKNTTNDLIGEALANLTGEAIDFEKESQTFRKVYWCYTEKAEKLSHIWESICNNIICPFVMTQYVCCRYSASELKQGPDSTRSCHAHVYKSQIEWWTIPFVLGLVLFIYSPFLHLLFASSMMKWYPEERTSSGVVQLLSHIEENIEGSGGSELMEDTATEERVALPNDLSDRFVSEESNYVTVCETLSIPFKYMCHMDRVRTSRFVRILFPFLCCSIIFLEIILDNSFMREYVQSCLEKGVPLGFRTLSAGFKDSKNKFLAFIGGPYIALMFYVGFSWITLTPHRDCGECLSGGIYDYQKARSPLFIPISVKEELGSVKINTKQGYDKLSSYLKAHFFMILNVDFWHLSFLIFKARFRHLWFALRVVFHPAIAIFAILLPGCILLAACIVELVLALVFYCFPIIGNGFVLTNGMTRVFMSLTRHRNSFKYKVLKFTFSLFYSVMFLFAYSVFCLIFLESFLFLSRVLLYTYVGIIRYPRQSYGYIIAWFMTVFYLMESINGFRRAYEVLLRTAIKIVRRLSKHEKTWIGTLRTTHNFYISREFYEYLISNTKPRRVQMFFTFLKCSFSLGMVSLSVALIKYFDKYSELSVVIQVITILMVGALPMVLKLVCSGRRYEGSRSRRDKSEIRRLTKKYINMKMMGLETRSNVKDLFRRFCVFNDNGYEALP